MLPDIGVSKPAIGLDWQERAVFQQSLDKEALALLAGYSRSAIDLGVVCGA